MVATLALEELIIESMDDTDVMVYLTVGFHSDKSLVIRLEYTDSNHPDEGYVKDARIDKEAAYRMAVRLRVGLLDLPTYLSKRFGREVGVPTPSEGGPAFEELLYFVRSCGIRYAIKKYK